MAKGKLLVGKSEQEVFDMVAAHLKRQRARSVRGTTTTCAYRGQEGRSCAVGCLIPDDRYDPCMDADYDDTSVDAHPKVRALFPERLLSLLSALQLAHDNGIEDDTGKTRFRLKLKEVAARHGLAWREPRV